MKGCGEFFERGKNEHDWDYRRASSYLKSAVIQHLKGGCMDLPAASAALEFVCDIFLDHEEGPVRGGWNHEHLDYSPLNEARVHLYRVYGLPLKRFSRLPAVLAGY